MAPGRERPGSLLFLPGSAAGASQKAPPTAGPGGVGGTGHGCPVRPGTPEERQQEVVAVALVTSLQFVW